MIIKLILSVSLAPFFLSTATAQKLFVSPETKLITCDTIINAEKTADELFDKATSWFVEYFPRGGNIQSAVKPNLIRGSYTIAYSFSMSKQSYRSDILLKIKDGAIKITIDNMTTLKSNGEDSYHIEWMGTKGGKVKTGAMYAKTNNQIEAQFKALVTNLRAYIDKKSDF